MGSPVTGGPGGGDVLRRLRFLDLPQQNHIFSPNLLFLFPPVDGRIGRSVDGPVILVGGGTVVVSGPGVGAHDLLQEDLVVPVYPADLVVRERHVFPPVGGRGGVRRPAEVAVVGAGVDGVD